MDFDNRKVYGDTSITDGLVYEDLPGQDTWGMIFHGLGTVRHDLPFCRCSASATTQSRIEGSREAYYIDLSCKAGWREVPSFSVFLCEMRQIYISLL